MADGASTKGLITEGVSESRSTSVETDGWEWPVVESTNGTLGLWLVHKILNLENIGGSSSILIHFERLISQEFSNTHSTSAGSRSIRTSTIGRSLGTITGPTVNVHFNGSSCIVSGPFSSYTGEFSSITGELTGSISISWESKLKSLVTI